MAQKEAQGVAEKRKGRRGPGSVIGSSAAGCVCALLSIYGIGGEAFARLWELGFVASFCTKLSDTVSSEIGKAYGKTTYLVTTFKIVPRGTEGAVSVEGTFAGLLASILLASIGCLLGQIYVSGAIICVVASQIANLGESIIGAALQEKEGFRWLNNDAVMSSTYPWQHPGSPYAAINTPKLANVTTTKPWPACMINRSNHLYMIYRQHNLVDAALCTKSRTEERRARP
ncbi:protein VTE6, chloroplastic [Sesamum alatum]|uniref:Protein VTE6, chloroplastic n=1 Tax=Sesamum alatum TaxID=300844 RepID=A0AAE1YZ22_9LAMI|nr:protein VTE6, chloroplastic [Sesamum alatum]